MVAAHQTIAPQLKGELLGATAFVTDDAVGSERLERDALEIGRTSGNADLERLAMTAVGGALVRQGRTAEGLALLDEAWRPPTLLEEPYDSTVVARVFSDANAAWSR